MASHGQQFESPVDLRGKRINERHAFGWTTATIAVASLFLLLTNAEAIHAWVEEQPTGPVQAQAAELSGQWLATTEAIGLATPRAALHARWKAAQAARFED